MVLRSSTSAPWNSLTNSAHVVWSELTRRMPSLMSAPSMMSRICLVMSRTWVRFSLNIVKVFRTTFKVCTSLPPSVVHWSWPVSTASAHGAEGGNRTPTALADQRILSPLRLPVPPPRPNHRRPRHMEAASGFEPLNRGFADLRLSHLATPPYTGPDSVSAPKVERETGFEPATPTLARLCSTTELFPHTSASQTSANCNKRLEECQLTGASGHLTPEVFRRLLGRGRVDEETRSPLEPRHPRQLGNDLEVPVEVVEGRASGGARCGA